MLNWFFKNNTKRDLYSNLPETQTVPPVPEVQPAKEKDPSIVISVGLTDNDRISLSVGNLQSVFMNRAGAESLIRMIQAAIPAIDSEVLDTDPVEELQETEQDDTEDGC